MLFCPQPNCYLRQLAYSHHNERRKTLLQFHGFLLWTELKQDRKNEVGLIGLDFDSEREDNTGLNSTYNLFQQNPHQCNKVWLSFSAPNAEKKTISTMGTECNYMRLSVKIEQVMLILTNTQTFSFVIYSFFKKLDYLYPSPSPCFYKCLL